MTFAGRLTDLEAPRASLHAPPARADEPAAAPPALARGTERARPAVADEGEGQGKEPSAQASFAFAATVAAPPTRHRPPAPAPRRWDGHDQLGLTLGPEYDEVTPPIPTTYADCKGPAHQQLMAECGGTCPVLRCRHHVALWLRDREDDDAIGSIKIEGGVARGRTARGTRALTDAGEDALAKLVEDLADRMAKLAATSPELRGLESLCSLDYADRWRLTPLGIRRILGLRPRRMTKLLTDAADELDIARARMRRQDAAAKADEHRRKLEAAELVQIKRKPKPCK